MKLHLFFILLFLSHTILNAQSKPKSVPAKLPKQVNSSQISVPDEPKIVEAGPGKDVVGVYHFTTSRDYTYDYAIGVGNAVEAGFLKSERFVVVERNRFGVLKDEDRFKEANTSEIVKKASRLGAKIMVTGHITGYSYGDLLDSYGKNTGNEYAEISLSFKIIDVESGQIKMSEIIRGRGEGGTSAASIQQAYVAIGSLVRSYVANYLPQKFKFMSVTEKKERKKIEYLLKFKIWGGSDNGLKVSDVVELYSVSYIINPDTKKKIEEKQLIAQANIIEVNSGSTATCQIIDATQRSPSVLTLALERPETMIVEYKGNWYVKPKSFWDRL